jgi:hypothetical protein
VDVGSRRVGAAPQLIGTWPCASQERCCCRQRQPRFWASASIDSDQLLSHGTCNLKRLACCCALSVKPVLLVSSQLRLPTRLRFALSPAAGFWWRRDDPPGINNRRKMNLRRRLVQDG